MKKDLPARPNLDHLRRQSKELLAALEARNQEAAAIILKHLPAARGLAIEQVFQKRFRLADAQSAIARKNGFAGWPHLARHIEQLRSLEGTWSFARLEVDGTVLPAAMSSQSRILIDGDRFRTESPEAVYEGIFNINVESDPHEIDIEFVEGPEAGNTNFGIFQIDGDKLDICLDMNGKPRPRAFSTSPGSGQAFETLHRTSGNRPADVKGGNAAADRPVVTTGDPADFVWVESPLSKRLQGKWTATKIVNAGQELPAMMLMMGQRVATKNELKVTFGGQVMIHALIRLNESVDPVEVDYLTLAGPAKGTVQYGIFKWVGDEACFCMAPHGSPRPKAFAAPPGSPFTLSQWRFKK